MSVSRLSKICSHTVMPFAKSVRTPVISYAELSNCMIASTELYKFMVDLKTLTHFHGHSSERKL